MEIEKENDIELKRYGLYVGRITESSGPDLFCSFFCTFNDLHLC